MFDQTIYAIGIGQLGGQFGTNTLVPGPITKQIQSITSSEAFGFGSVGNITLTGNSILSAEQFGKVRITSLSIHPDVSTKIKTQFPQFVGENHEHFIMFMEAYYEWMESYGQAIYESKSLLKNQDIDQTVDMFVDYFRKEFLVNIPKQITADKALILKNIKEYYRARGTEKSFQFFFRLLLGLDATFYYPRVDVFRVSDGKWIQPKTLRVSAIQGNPIDLVGRKIRGLNNNSSAFVESVQIVQENFITVYEIYLNRSSITGLFDPEEIIRTGDGSNIRCQITPLPLEIKVQNPGLGYQVDQSVIINGVGSGATAKISSVDTSGRVLKVKITNYGAAYFGAPTVSFPVYPGVTQQATGLVIIGALTNYPGYYLNEDGQLSTTKFLQDSYYYQQFSYVVQVNESVDIYRDALKKGLHPAGLIFFGTVLSQNFVDGSVKLPSRTNSSGFLLTRILQQFSQPFLPGQYRPVKFMCKPHNELKVIHWLKEEATSYKLGPSYRSIERDKFRYRPTERYDANQEVLNGSNTDYWSGPIHAYANYQIKDFKDIIIKDMNERPWTKINISPEPVLKTSN